jgi:LuxR family maltose regulon positive regulatory protein
MIATRLIRRITPHGVIHTITPDRTPNAACDFVLRLNYCGEVVEGAEALYDEKVPPLSHALLETPHSTGELLTRPRLIERFDIATHGLLTIVSGEPAAGKTSVVLDWLNSDRGRDRPIAWLTVNASFNDPVLFWRYMLAVVEPLGVVADDLGRALSDEGAPGPGWLTTFANRLAKIPGDPVLVIDDFHLIERRETLAPVHDLIEGLAESAHLVLLTRAKPPWRLDRWRANGVLSEIESDELRFTVAEATQLIQSADSHQLSLSNVELLARRTEGWAGGLRLALLSLAHTADPEVFIRGFTGNDELVSSYLFREVLESQPNEIREFLLDVSVLNEFTSELCDEIRDASDSTQLLDRCRTANLFVIDLDKTGTRCRLHALFAQLLRARLAAHDPERLAALHERASYAAEARRDLDAAVNHAFGAGASERAGELIAQFASRLVHRGQFETLDRWVLLLSRGPSGTSPETALGLAASLCLSGHPDEADHVLDRLVEQGVSEDVEYAAMQLRGMITMFIGRIDRLGVIATELNREVPTGDLSLPFEPQRLAAHFEAVHSYYAEDFPAARNSAERATDIRERPSLFYIEAPGQLARVCVAEGNLTDAVRHAKESLRRAESLGSTETAVRLKPNLAMGDVEWERNDLDGAEAHLATASRSVRPLLWQAVLVQIASSRLLASRGALDQARDELTDAAQTYWTGDTPPSQRVLLTRAAIDLALGAGDIGDALRWGQAYSNVGGPEIGSAFELRLARARGQTDLMALVDRMLAGDEPLPRRIDTLLTGAEIVAELGDDRRAQELVGQATVLGEPERFVRRFVEAGERVRAILMTFASSPAGDDVVVASPVFIDLLVDGLRSTRTTTTRSGALSELVVPMSERELEVLDRLLAGLSYREMADQLYISRNTVKTHVRHVYSKLGVASRGAALDEARRLGIT